MRRHKELVVVWGSAVLIFFGPELSFHVLPMLTPARMKRKSNVALEIRRSPRVHRIGKLPSDGNVGSLVRGILSHLLSEKAEHGGTLRAIGENITTQEATERGDDYRLLLECNVATSHVADMKEEMKTLSYTVQSQGKEIKTLSDMVESQGKQIKRLKGKLHPLRAFAKRGYSASLRSFIRAPLEAIVREQHADMETREQHADMETVKKGLQSSRYDGMVLKLGSWSIEVDAGLKEFCGGRGEFIDHCLEICIPRLCWKWLRHSVLRKWSCPPQ